MKILPYVLLFGILLFPISCFAKDLRVLLLETMPVPVVINHSNAIATELNSLAERTGWEIAIEVLKAEGSKPKAVEQLQEAIGRQRPDLVISVATLGTQAAKQVLSNTGIPLLFCVVADPVGSGIVEKIGVPSGTNISGVVYTQQRDTKVEMAMRMLAGTRYAEKVRFGVVSSDYPSAMGDLRELRKIAATFDNIEFLSRHIPYRPVPEGIAEMHRDMLEAVKELAPQVDFLWEVPGPLTELPQTSQLLVDTGKPVIMGNIPKSVEVGVLMSVAVDYENSGRELVEKAEKIFRGEWVGNLPVTIPKKFNLYINMETANRLGLTVPSHLLMISGENIYYGSTP